MSPNVFCNEISGNNVVCSDQNVCTGGGDTPGCGAETNNPATQRSYLCSGIPNTPPGSCTYTDTPYSCDVYDDCSKKYCLDTSHAADTFDCYVVGGGKSCTCDCKWLNVEDCLAKPSVDSDGDNPAVAGTCGDYTACWGGTCDYGTYSESCDSSTVFKEYVTSSDGTMCIIKPYFCTDFEVLATDNDGDNPALTGTCTGGEGATCSGSAFSTTQNPNGIEGCVDSSACPGGANCKFREYVAGDSDDACPGLDACVEKLYDSDTNSNTCNSCVPGGWGTWGGTQKCCGDDANEIIKTRVCSGGACTSDSNDKGCCSQSTDCVYGGICSSNGYSNPSLGGAICANGVWSGTPPCQNKECGQACALPAQGICDGPNGICYPGGCLLNCAVPSAGAGNSRVWMGQNCGRTSSIKSGAGSICAYSSASCTTGDSSTQVTGNWSSYTPPSGSYKVGQAFQIILGGVTRSPAGFTILSECSVTKPGGSIIYFDNWGTDVTFSYTFTGTDQEGIWTVNSCQLWSDFAINSGWQLKQDLTPHTFVLDKSPPNVTINKPKQNDIYAKDFLVNATVTDLSPIDSVRYRWENATSNGSWVGMGSGGGYYTANFNAAAVSDGNYSIRVAANDSVGNANENVVGNVLIHRQPPNITILDPSPGWYRSDFEVKARVTDNQGISVVRYRWENSTNTGLWNVMTTGADGNYTAIFNVNSVYSGNYTIVVWANDTLDNSANRTVGIGIDYVSPFSMMTKPAAGSYIMDNVFTISWSGSDAHSGIRCHYVNYKYCDDHRQCPAAVYNVTFPGGKCTSLTEYEFNPSNELPSIHDFNNYTFFFRSIALDNAGNAEPAKTAWETNATVYVPTLVTFSAIENVTFATIRNGGKVANNRAVIISVKAKAGVGNLNITVYHYAHTLGLSPPQQLPDWNITFCQDTIECNASVTTDVSESEGRKEVDYAIRAESAGANESVPPTAPSAYFYYTVYNHPLCNFLVSDVLRTVMGSSEIIAIEVRNIQDMFDIVDLKFDGGPARFLENDQQSIKIPLSSMEEKLIYARLIPPPPSEEGLPLTILGNSTLGKLQDEDTINIIVGLPANFYGLSDVAILALVLLAGMIYFKLVKI